MSGDALAQRLHELAASSHGILLAGELSASGVTRPAARGLLRRGWLVMVRRGAYLVGGGPPTEWHHLVAAYRLAGSDAVVSHWPAARMYRLAVAPRPVGPELTIVGSPHRRLEGVHVHRVERIQPAQIAIVRGIRVTAPVRTLIDLAPALGADALERVVDEGLIARRWELEELSVALAEAPRRAGVGTLRSVVSRRVGSPAAPGRYDSPLELRVAKALVSCGPFETQHQVVVAGQVFVIDIAWPELLVAVECEGWEVRARSLSKFDHERRKFNLLAAHGWTVLHVTTAMSDEEIRAAVIPVLLAAAGRAVGGAR